MLLASELQSAAKLGRGDGKALQALHVLQSGLLGGGLLQPGVDRVDGDLEDSLLPIESIYGTPYPAVPERYWNPLLKSNRLVTVQQLYCWAARTKPVRALMPQPGPRRPDYKSGRLQVTQGPLTHRERGWLADICG